MEVYDARTGRLVLPLEAAKEYLLDTLSEQAALERTDSKRLGAEGENPAKRRYAELEAFKAELEPHIARLEARAEAERQAILKRRAELGLPSSGSFSGILRSTPNTDDPIQQRQLEIRQQKRLERRFSRYRRLGQ